MWHRKMFKNMVVPNLASILMLKVTLKDLDQIGKLVQSKDTITTLQDHETIQYINFELFFLVFSVFLPASRKLSLT